jgi:hypothetical protein
MGRILDVCLMAAIASAGWAQVPEIPYDSVPNFIKLPPDIYFGEVSGVALNSQKHIFVFSRGNSTGPAYAATAAQLLEFGPDGKFIREIGKNLYAWSYAHNVRIDKDDNIWAIDKGSDMIIKFNPAGRVVMVFGRKKEASDGAEYWFASRPTSPGTQMATSTSATATSTRGLPSSIRTAIGLSPGARSATNRASSTWRTALRPTSMETSTLPTARIYEFRCSMGMVSFCARSRSMFLSLPAQKRGWLQHHPERLDRRNIRRVLPGQFASRPGRRNTCMLRMLFPAGYTK